ncbi:MAG TPA: SRPBCC family protein [Gemmatimonadaceae bacterium]|jgi:uncharacterized protein YndB with AHSA1/START domain
MITREQYVPGPARDATIQKRDGDKWTLVLVRQLRQSPEKVWKAITDPAELKEWAPFDVDRNLATVGVTFKLTWVGSPTPIELTVTRADAPKVLEFTDMRWELEPVAGGTRLTLWSSLDRRYVAMGASGWHICLDALDQFVAGTPMGRIAGPAAMKSEGWKELLRDYANLLRAEVPSW